MATTPTPMPDQSSGAPPGQTAGGGAPPASQPPDQSPQGQGQSAFQGPATPLQRLLAQWSEVAKQMATSDPRLAAGAQKVSEGIRDMQTALITPQQPTPLGQQPQY
jgi:hypothetical protein